MAIVWGGRLEMFVIVHENGSFVAPPGQESSYVKNLQDARTFPTREAAERERCPANERVVALTDIVLRPQTW